VDTPYDPRGEGYYYYYWSDGEDFKLRAIMANGTDYVYSTSKK
jgi:hypothetical protein